jgi:hypothetical protein
MCCISLLHVCARLRDGKCSLYRKNRLEINDASNQVKNIIARNKPTLEVGFGSRGGISRTSVNSFSGGQVTLQPKHKDNTHSCSLEVETSTNGRRTHLFLGVLLPVEGCNCRMDFVAEGALGVRQLAAGDNAASPCNVAAEECGISCSSTSSSERNRNCKGWMAGLTGEGGTPLGASSAAVSASSDELSRGCSLESRLRIMACGSRKFKETALQKHVCCHP